MTQFDIELRKHYRYILYLMSKRHFEMPESLTSPLDIAIRRSHGETCIKEAEALYDEYLSYLDRPKIVTLVGSKTVKTIFLCSYAVATIPASMEELVSIIDSLESMFNGPLGFHEFE